MLHGSAESTFSSGCFGAALIDHVCLYNRAAKPQHASSTWPALFFAG